MNKYIIVKINVLGYDSKVEFKSKNFEKWRYNFLWKNTEVFFLNVELNSK